MNNAPKSTTDSSVFGIPMTHLRDSNFEFAQLASNGTNGTNGTDDHDSVVGTFVGGIHEFVGDQPNRILRCLNNQEFYSQQQQFELPVDSDDRFSMTDIWPVVLYGKSGTGKTSLALTLITNFVRARNLDNRKPVCLTGADFFRRFRSAIETQSVEEFQDKILESAGLFIDNLEQLENKDTTQHELATLLDRLAQRGRPVVITMSCFPQECERLAPKLVSRLTGGLCLPTHAPGREARLELTKQLAEIHQISLTDEAIDWVVSRLSVTVPKLNHFFIQLRTELRSQKPDTDQKPGPISLDVSDTIDVFTLAKIFRRSDIDEDRLITLIQKEVAQEFHLKTDQLKSQSRKRTIVLARGIAIYLQRELLGTSFLKIGSYFGNRDHSTVMHSYRKIKSMADSEDDSVNKQSIDQLRQRLNELFAGQLTVVF